MVRTALDEGTNCLNAGQFEKASSYFEQALRLCREIKDRQDEATALRRLGVALDSMGQHTKAIGYWEQALQICRELKDQGNAAKVLQNLGIAYRGLSQYPKAIAYCKQALAIYRKVKDINGQARALTNLGNIFNQLSRYDASISYYKQAVPLYQALNDRDGLATAYLDLGIAYRRLSQYRTEINYLDQALSIFREVKDRDGEAMVLNDLGIAYDYTSQYEKAVSYFEQALPTFRELKDQEGEASTLSSLGMAYDDLSRYQRAVEYSDQALLIYRKIGDRDGEAKTLDQLGEAYGYLNEYHKATSCFTQALQAYRAIGDRNGEAIALDNLGFSYEQLRQFQKASNCFENALTVYRQVKDLYSQAGALTHIGVLCNDLHLYDRALKYYAQALEICRGVHDLDGEANVLGNRGVTYKNLGRYVRATADYQQALRLFREAKDRSGEARALDHLMVVWSVRHQPGLAIFYGKQSVDAYQHIRSDLSKLNRQLRKGYIDSVSDAYRRLADLLIRQGRLVEAQCVMRLLKQEEYYEFARRDAAQTDSDGEMALTQWETKYAEFYRQKADRITAIAAELDALDGKPDRTAAENHRMHLLGHELDYATQAFEEFLTAMNRAFADHDKTSASNVTPLAATQDAENFSSTLNELHKTTHARCAALYTLVAEHKLWIILAMPGAQIARSAALTQEQLNRTVFAFRNALMHPEIDPRPLGKQLYDWLIGPVEKDLVNADINTLMWSLDGTLRYIPLDALWDGHRYLLQRFGNEVFTQANRDHLKDAVSTWNVLGLGVSKPHPGFAPLPAVVQELRDIVHDVNHAEFGTGVFAGTVLLDDDFTLNTMRTQLEHGDPEGAKYKVMHIASHFDFGHDKDSSYLLIGRGEDGKDAKLSLTELGNLPSYYFRDVQLICLSACNTALSGQSSGEYGNGKEVDGLGELMQKKGVGAVLASLWPVADRSTELLMKAFYQQRQAHPEQTKLEALRQAQLALLNGGMQGVAVPGARGLDSGNNSSGSKVSSQPAFTPNPKAPYAHPYYWAPFILIGNWR